MATFDLYRFHSSLVGAFIADEWTASALAAVLKRATDERPVRVPGLVPRMLAAFPTKSEFVALFLFFLADVGYRRALRRMAGLRTQSA